MNLSYKKNEQSGGDRSFREKQIKEYTLQHSLI